MAKKKIELTEQEHLANKARLGEIINDTKDIISIGGNDYAIGALRYYTKWRISSLITKIELSDTNIINLVEAMALNVPLMAEILALAIVNDRVKIERGEAEEIKWALTDSAENMEWGLALRTIFSKLDTGFFFGLTEMVRELNGLNDKAGYRRQAEEMMKMKEGDGYTPIRSMGR